jgi:hypothetical protein
VSDYLVLVFVPGVTVMFFGFVALLQWMDHRHKQRLRTIVQEERFRLLEKGFPFDEAALERARSEAVRYGAVGAIGVATALALSGALIVATVLVMSHEGASPVILIVAWAVGCPVVLGAVAVCVANMKPRNAPTAGAAETSSAAAAHAGSTAITTGRPVEAPHS